MEPGSNVRRIFAVFVDFFVFFGIWVASGFLPVTAPGLWALGFLFVLDVLLTAFFGASLGRWIANIRVVRADGGRPGLVAALIRTGVVFLTGWAGLLVFAKLGVRVPPRVWWDAAAGTRVVAGRSLPAS
jgi:uncharacterized RDD family membrane protein YckC